MKIQRTEYGALTVLTPRGDFSGEHVEVFREETRRCLEDGHKELVVDCSGMSSFDSAGLEALTELLRSYRESEGRLRLCGLDSVGRKIFELTRLARLFEVYDDVESALRSF